MSFRRALLLSVVLHGIFLGFLFWKKELAPKPQNVLFVDLSGPGKRSGARVGGKSASAGQRGLKGWRPLPKGWTWKSGKTYGGSESGSVAGAMRGKGEEVFSFGEGMGLKEEGKFFSFAEKIYRRVDSFVGYPPDFVEENLSGAVLLHILVDERGRFTGKFLEIEADDELLKVYTMAMVALALREPLAPPSEKKEIPIAIRVEYRLRLPDEFSGKKDGGHFKNALRFERVAYTDPKPIKEARRFIEKYTPPIIPVPGGFYIDFVSLYKHIKEIDGNDEKWRRGVRMELQRQELELFLKKKVS